MAKAYAHDPSNPFAVHNYCSENRYLLSDLVGMYKEKLVTKIDVLPTSEWMRKDKALGMPPGIEATVLAMKCLCRLSCARGASHR